MADIDVNHIRPMQPLIPVRRVEKPQKDRREDEARRQRPASDDGEQPPAVDTYA